MDIFGKKLSKDEILNRIGDITQFGGIKQTEIIDGAGKGIRKIDMKSPCGLDISILLDRGMDISSMFYKSIPICWKSATKETSSIYYESINKEFLRTFYGGLLTTCGLTYMGFPCIDDGEVLGQHGRISNLPAENVWTDGKWENDNYIMWVQGKIREVKAFGYKLELSRKITTFMDVPKIIIEDTVENIGFTKSPIMILYHINIGYPLLDDTSKLIEGNVIVKPRDEEAQKNLEKYSIFCKPIAGFREQVFFHDIEKDNEGNSNIAIVNEDFNNGEGIGISIKFNKNNLPYLVQWKQMGLGEYVCGLEPSNSLPRGRNIERKEGTLKYINPKQKIKYKLEINILTSNKEIEKFKMKYCQFNGRKKDEGSY